MKRGIIVAMDERFLTLLTNEGEFYYSYKYEAVYEIGQEIEFEPVAKYAKAKSVRKPTFVKALMLAALFVLSFLGLSSWPSDTEQTIHAYMTIDINPSLELAVNEQFEVIQLKGYNEDGEKVLAALPDWENRKFDMIFTDILSVLKSQGYIAKNRELTFATVIISNQLSEDSVKQHTDFVAKEVDGENLQLRLVEGSKKERQLARENGLTLGAYKAQNKETSVKNTAKSDAEELEEHKKAMREEEQEKKKETEEEPQPHIEDKVHNETESTSNNHESANENINETKQIEEKSQENHDHDRQFDEKYSPPSSIAEKGKNDEDKREKPRHHENKNKHHENKKDWDESEKEWRHEREHDDEWRERDAHRKHEKDEYEDEDEDDERKEREKEHDDE